MDWGIAQGLERATGNMAATGMKLMEFQANQRHQQALEADSKARLQIAQKTADIKNAKGNIELDAVRKQEEFLNSGWEPLVDPVIRALPEQDRQGFVDTIEQMKIPKTQRGRQQAAQILESTPKLFESYSKSLFQGRYDKYQKIEAEYNAALEKGDRQKIAEIKPRFDAAAEEINRTRGEIDKGIKKVAMNESWMNLTPEFKSAHPEIQALYESGHRTGDTKPYTDALEELSKPKEKVETWGPEQQGKGGTTVQKSSRGKINTVFKPPKPEKLPATSTPANDRMLLKDALAAEVKLLEAPDSPSASAYAEEYNAVSKDYEYVKKEKEGFFGKSSEWVKQPKVKISGAMKEKALRDDLMKNGHTKKSADEYVKKAKAAGKL